MSHVGGPVSMTVRVESQVDATNRLVYETEFVVSDEDEAREKGHQFVLLMRAFGEGFGDA